MVLLTFLIMPLIFIWMFVSELRRNPRKKKKGKYKVSFKQHLVNTASYLIFGYNTNRYVHICVMIFGLLILPLMLIGTVSNMLITPALFSVLQLLALALSIAVTVYLFWLWYLETKQPESSRTDVFSNSDLPRWQLVAALFWLPALFIFIPLVYGAPYVLHSLSGNYASLDLVVGSKTSSYHQRGCSGELIFQHYDMLNRTLCGFEPELWHSVQPGDTVRVYGRVSALGFSFDNMAIKLTSAITDTK